MKFKFERKQTHLQNGKAAPNSRQLHKRILKLFTHLRPWHLVSGSKKPTHIAGGQSLCKFECPNCIAGPGCRSNKLQLNYSGNGKTYNEVTEPWAQSVMYVCESTGIPSLLKASSPSLPFTGSVPSLPLLPHNCAFLSFPIIVHNSYLVVFWEPLYWAARLLPQLPLWVLGWIGSLTSV